MNLLIRTLPGYTGILLAFLLLFKSFHFVFFEQSQWTLGNYLHYDHSNLVKTEDSKKFMHKKLQNRLSVLILFCLLSQLFLTILQLLYPDVYPIPSAVR